MRNLNIKRDSVAYNRSVTSCNPKKMKFSVVLLCVLVGWTQAAPDGTDATPSKPDPLGEIISTLLASLLNQGKPNTKSLGLDMMSLLGSDVGRAAIDGAMTLYDEFSREDGFFNQNKEVLSEIFAAGQSIVKSYIASDQASRAKMAKDLTMDVLNAVGIASLQAPFFEQAIEDSAVDIARYLVKQTRAVLGQEAEESEETDEEYRADEVPFDAETVLAAAAAFLQSFADAYQPTR